MRPLQASLNDWRQISEVEPQIHLEWDEGLQFLAPTTHLSVPDGSCTRKGVLTLIEVKFNCDVNIAFRTNVASDSTAEQIDPLDQRPARRPLRYNQDERGDFQFSDPMMRSMAIAAA